MDTTADWKHTAPFRFGEAGDSVGNTLPPQSPGLIRHQAITVLLQRGYSYVGEDSLGLPCFRSRSGAMLIAVGSCRCLAYGKVAGRLQVIATARTLALLCRVSPDAGDGAVPASEVGARPRTDLGTPHPETALLI